MPLPTLCSHKVSFSPDRSSSCQLEISALSRSPVHSQSPTSEGDRGLSHASEGTSSPLGPCPIVEEPLSLASPTDISISPSPCSEHAQALATAGSSGPTDGAPPSPSADSSYPADDSGDIRRLCIDPVQETSESYKDEVCNIPSPIEASSSQVPTLSTSRITPCSEGRKRKANSSRSRASSSSRSRITSLEKRVERLARRAKRYSRFQYQGHATRSTPPFVAVNIKQPMEYSCKSWFGWQQAKKWCSWLKDKGKYWHHSFWGMTPNKLKRLYQQQAATIAQPRQGIKLVAQPTTGPKLLLSDIRKSADDGSYCGPYTRSQRRQHLH